MLGRYNTLEMTRSIRKHSEVLGILCYNDLELYTLERGAFYSDDIPNGTYQVKLETKNHFRHIYIENPLLIGDKAEIVFETTEEKMHEILIGEQAILNYRDRMKVKESKKAFDLLWRRLYTNCAKKGIDIVLQVNRR